MKVLVSACVLGENCKYNGKSNRNEAVIRFLRDKEVIPICPEMLAHMGIPRPCAEIVGGIVTDQYGSNVHAQYTQAVELALAEIRHQDIDLVILQSRSPTCGAKHIYDGSFTGKLIPGLGLFAAALMERGYPVVDVEDLEK